MSEQPSFVRGGVAVVVRDGGPAHAAVRAHTPADVPVLVLGGSDEDAASAVAPADLVLVEADVRVAPGWLDGLRAAAGTDGTVATADTVALTRAPEQVPEPRLRPRTLAPTWGCTLVTRAALELAGPLDAGFAARCAATGLVHVVADDVLVAAERERPAPADDLEPAARARWRVRQLTDGISVTVDARILRAPLAGTQVHTLELISALHRAGSVRLRVLLPGNPTPTAEAVLDGLDGLERLAEEDARGAPPTAVVHRPYQVTNAADLLVLRDVGRRLVVTHQDLLLYHVPEYHTERKVWEDYRTLTRLALGAAHRVVAFSAHAAADLRAEDLVAPERLRVVPIGVDHRLAELAVEPRAPRDVPTDAPYLLCLGTDLRHKNRIFALALLRELRARGWPGKLVLAGVHAAAGSSAGDERRLLASDRDLAAAVVDAAAPDEAEKAWLYAHAAAALYPTVYEGFGLVPFEAAAHGVPTVFAQAALDEALGAYARIVPWDPAASAERALEVLTPGPGRERLVAAIRSAGDRFTWDATARALTGIYEETLALPEELGWVGLHAEVERARFEHLYWSLRNDIGPTGLALVGEHRLLPEDAQRTLAGLARRPATRRVLLSVLSGLRRLVGR